jgi:hypothetical protein
VPRCRPGEIAVNLRQQHVARPSHNSLSGSASTMAVARAAASTSGRRKTRTSVGRR